MASSTRDTWNRCAVSHVGGLKVEPIRVGHGIVAKVDLADKTSASVSNQVLIVARVESARAHNVEIAWLQPHHRSVTNDTLRSKGTRWSRQWRRTHELCDPLERIIIIRVSSRSCIFRCKRTTRETRDRIHNTRERLFRVGHHVIVAKSSVVCERLRVQENKLV